MEQRDPNTIHHQTLALEKAIEEKDIDTIKESLSWFEQVEWNSQQAFLKRDFLLAKEKLVFSLDSVKEEVKTEHVEEIDHTPKLEDGPILEGEKVRNPRKDSPVEIGSSNPKEEEKVKRKK